MNGGWSPALAGRVSIPCPTPVQAPTCRGVQGPHTDTPSAPEGAGRVCWLGVHMENVLELSSVSGTGSVALAGRSSGSVMTHVLRVHGVCPCGSVAQWSGHRFWRPRPPHFLCQVRGWMGRPGRASQHRQSRHEAFTPQASPSPGSARPSSRLWA